ncbi:hypothetical protein Goari_004554, partial [Gossypium aridum]|nr:hypothetical protein [Gossypium aridum]
VVFKTRIYHCNVDAAGNLSLDILKDSWSPALTISKIWLFFLMTDSPLTSGVARLYLADKAKHDEIASEWTLRILYLLLDERSVLEELEGPTIMASNSSRIKDLGRVYRGQFTWFSDSSNSLRMRD